MHTREQWVQVRLDPVFKGCHQGLSLLASVLPSTHSAPCSDSIQWSPQFQTYMTENEGLVIYLVPPTNNSSGKQIKSLRLPIENKRLLKKKKKKLNPAKSSSTSFQLGTCPDLNQFPWSGNWLGHTGTVLKLRQNPILQNGGERIFIRNLWVLITGSRWTRC